MIDQQPAQRKQQEKLLTLIKKNEARSEEFMGRQAGRTGTVEEVPQRVAATTLTPFMQL